MLLYVSASPFLEDAASDIVIDEFRILINDCCISIRNNARKSWK